jgi:hypothetical protein
MFFNTKTTKENEDHKEMEHGFGFFIRLRAASCMQQAMSDVRTLQSLFHWG